MNRFFVGLVLLCVTMTGCGSHSADVKDQQLQEQLQAEATRQTGMPAIVNFTERKNLKWIYELCDREKFTTYTYIVDLNGKLHFLCESIGYGVPYSAQYSNPEKVSYHGANAGYQVTPQAEPNGIFKPVSSDATWVIAATKDGPQPIYVEPRIVVSPFRLPCVEDESASAEKQ